MKSKLILFVILILLSCNNEKNNHIKKNIINSNCKKLIIKLNLNKKINKVIFVPDNSCKGCLKQTLEMCELLSSKSNVKLFFIDELKIEKNICAMDNSNIDLDFSYSNYEIYGITLYELLKDSIKITYIDPSNIDSIYTSILIN